MTFAFSYRQFWALGYGFSTFFFIVNQHNPDVISNQIRAKRKEEKKTIKCFKLQKVNTLEVPTIPFSKHGGLCNRCVPTMEAFNSAPAKPTALTMPGFPSAAFTFLQKSLFDKTEASHSHKMHKKKKKHDKFKNTTVTVQIQTQQLTEPSHVKHVELFTAKLTTQIRLWTHKAMLQSSVYFFRLHQY